MNDSDVEDLHIIVVNMSDAVVSADAVVPAEEIFVNDEDQSITSEVVREAVYYGSTSRGRESRGEKHFRCANPCSKNTYNMNPSTGASTRSPVAILYSNYVNKLSISSLTSKLDDTP